MELRPRACEGHLWSDMLAVTSVFFFSAGALEFHGAVGVLKLSRVNLGSLAVVLVL